MENILVLPNRYGNYTESHRKFVEILRRGVVLKCIAPFTTSSYSMIGKISSPFTPSGAVYTAKLGHADWH